MAEQLTGKVYHWLDEYGWKGYLRSIQLELITTGGGVNAAFAFRVNGEILVDAHGLVLAMPLVGIATDLSGTINSAVTSKSVTVDTAAANSESILYGGSYYSNGSSTIALGDLSSSNIEDFTFESWCYLSNTTSQYGFFSNQNSDNAANTMRIGTSGGDEIWMKIGSSSLQTLAIHL